MARLLSILVVAAIALAVPQVLGKEIFCFFDNLDSRFNIEEFNSSNCTYVIFTLVNISANANFITINETTLTSFQTLKDKNSNLKTLFSIHNAYEETYREVVKEPNLYKIIARNAIDFMKKNKFDGINLKYPCFESTAHDLFRTLAKEFNKNYIVMASVPANHHKVADVAKITDYVNFIHFVTIQLMYWPAPKTMDEFQGYNVILGLANWTANNSGIPANKTILRTTAYGISFTLENGTILEPTYLTYSEVCEKKKKESNWIEMRNNTFEVPCFVKGNQVIVSDNKESIARKTDVANLFGLAGVSLYSIETDDFSGSCDGEEYPLLNTIASHLEGVSNNN